MAHQHAPKPETQPNDPATEAERHRVRRSNDDDQAREREGLTSEHAAGYDEAVHRTRADRVERERLPPDQGGTQDVDPDSAASGVDRGDTVDEP